MIALISVCLHLGHVICKGKLNKLLGSYLSNGIFPLPFVLVYLHLSIKMGCQKLGSLAGFLYIVKWVIKCQQPRLYLFLMRYRGLNFKISCYLIK